ncbi:exoglucanase-like protein 1 precursor [Exidia glandulosa HHB12029]|uniref:Glucanase n=1 Tax=Exidia glandulosa HHB12029 TaxID=1314781 RepID=A0A165KSB4_EXIGL|nr:exoglucanase-like protein 1 precursor [Exidia glandulosa HHB12029]
MLSSSIVALSLSLGFARAQQVATNQAETHPSLQWQKCTGKNSCTNVAGSVVLDANWRWLHTTSGYTNCYTGNTWNTTLCPDGATCAKNCALDGADYPGTYGITSSGNQLTLKFVTQVRSTNIGSRVYLLDTESKYAMFDLKGNEFTFDIDVSKLPCGLNGALYFSEMDADGGMAKFSTNKAGAKYGTGYCDSQCPRDIKFINGEANVQGWNPSPNDTNAGTGNYGACCNEMDIWEANSISAAYTPHPCTTAGLSRCSGTACGGSDNRYGSVCDPDGCDFNSFRMGDKSFYGPSGTGVNTASKFTVVTQFISSGSGVGEIRRLYVQNGKLIANSKTAVTGMSAYDSITPAFCDAQKKAFNDTTSFQTKGGLAKMFTVRTKPMVLVMSIWDDHAANMLWLDSNYPTDRSASTPGTARGTCSTDSGKPTDVENNAPNSQVIFSNIKFGPINSTFTAT